MNRRPRGRFIKGESKKKRGLIGTQVKKAAGQRACRFFLP